eukprot:GHVU01096029.1.p1 GENE.GHVU01096029.1~~GHVU01096029.1.p1  ORF type:complete len:1059 (+),score=127.84 GHVU01096029.1:464-3178(+)
MSPPSSNPRRADKWGNAPVRHQMPDGFHGNLNDWQNLTNEGQSDIIKRLSSALPAPRDSTRIAGGAKSPPSNKRLFSELGTTRAGITHAAATDANRIPLGGGPPGLSRVSLGTPKAVPRPTTITYDGEVCPEGFIHRDPDSNLATSMADLAHQWHMSKPMRGLQPTMAPKFYQPGPEVVKWIPWRDDSGITEWLRPFVSIEKQPVLTDEERHKFDSKVLHTPVCAIPVLQEHMMRMVAECVRVAYDLPATASYSSGCSQRIGVNTSYTLTRHPDGNIVPVPNICLFPSYTWEDTSSIAEAYFGKIAKAVIAKDAWAGCPTSWSNKTTDDKPTELAMSRELIRRSCKQQVALLSTLPDSWIAERLDPEDPKILPHYVLSKEGCTSLRRRYFLEQQARMRQYLAVAALTMMPKDIIRFLEQVTPETNLEEAMTAIKESDSYQWAVDYESTPDETKAAFLNDQRAFTHWVTRLQPTMVRLFRSTEVRAVNGTGQIWDMLFEEALDCILGGMVEVVKEYPLSRILGNDDCKPLRLPYCIWKQERADGASVPIHPYTASMQCQEWVKRLELFAHMHEVPDPEDGLWKQVMLIKEQDSFEHFVLERPWDPELYMEIRMLNNGGRSKAPMILTTGPEYPMMAEAHAMAKLHQPCGLRSVTASFPVVSTPWSEAFTEQECVLPPQPPRWQDRAMQDVLVFGEGTPTVLEILDLDKFPSNDKELPDGQVYEYLALRYRRALDAQYWSQAACRLLASHVGLTTEKDVLDYLQSKIAEGKYIWEDIAGRVRGPIEIIENESGEWLSPVLGNPVMDPKLIYDSKKPEAPGAMECDMAVAAASAADTVMNASGAAVSGSGTDACASTVRSGEDEGGPSNVGPLSPSPSGDPRNKSPTEEDHDMDPTSPKEESGPTEA